MNKDIVSGVAIFLCALALNWAVAARVEIPIPQIHDEFSYLLAGDTYANGRLANPTHPMWKSFETFHVLSEPTYQSKYPPGQGVFLALGKLLGEPIYGVWISFSFAACAIYWMLRARFALAWSILGALLFISNTRILFSWGQSYWGGAVAVWGGALVIGSLLRIRPENRARTGVVLGIGLFVLSITRPAEGLFAALCLAPLLWLLLRDQKDRAQTLKPLLGLGLLTLSWFAFYNYLVTGKPWLPPALAWNPRLSEIPLIQNYQGSTERDFIRKILRLHYALAGGILTLFLVSAFADIKKLKSDIFHRCFTITFLAVTLFSVLFTKAWPHYLAPIVPLIFYFTVDQLFRVWRHRFLRYAAVLSLITFFSFSLSILISLKPGEELPGRYWGGSAGSSAWTRARARIAKRLSERPQKQLVMVRYSERHSSHAEWVYNGANIDEQKVVFARELSPEQNQKLLAYYPDREAWVVEADSWPVQAWHVKRDSIDNSAK